MEKFKHGNNSIIETILDHKDDKDIGKKSAVEFARMILSLHNEASSLKLSDLVQRVLEESGLIEMYSETDQEERLNNIAELEQMIQQYEHEHEKWDLPLFLQEMAELLGAKTFSVPDDEQSRARYHAAACIACNYLVTLTAMAQEIFSPWMDRPEDGLAAIMPLVKNTVNNLSRTGDAIDVLTGPIARGDTDTVDRHRLALSPNMREVYEALCKETIAQMLKKGKKG